MATESAETVPSRVAMRTGSMVYRRIHGPEVVAGTPAETLVDVLQAEGLEWIAAVPLRVQNRTVGVLTCYAVSVAPLSDSDMSLLSTIADQVAVALENARLYSRSRDLAALEERQRLARELHDSVSQALYGIALGTKTALTFVGMAALPWPGQASSDPS